MNTHTDKNQTIPVDAVLALSTPNTNAFETCPVLNISTQALDILLDQPLDPDTRVSLAVRPEGAGQRPYFVSGEVKQCGLQDAGWQVQIVASSARPWSPMFLYDVLCSTFDSVSVETGQLEHTEAARTAIAQPVNQLAA